MERYGAPRFASDKDVKDRRKKADLVVNLATILTVAAWLFAIVVLFLVEAASPDSEVNWFTSIGRIRGVDTVVRDYWDTTLLPIAFGLLIAALLACVFAFFFNKQRMRRKTDKYRKSIIIIGSITVVSIVYFLIQFGGYFLW